MQFVPHEPKQRTSLRNKMRGAVKGAIIGLIVGVLGALFFGLGVLFTAILVGALGGYGLVAIIESESSVLW
jgi:uncharacterized membrane-anchored protein YitT (DUF2179 family)